MEWAKAAGLFRGKERQRANGTGLSNRIVRQRIEQRLRRHIGDEELQSVCKAVLDGRVVRLARGAALDVVALRRGVLFVGGTEYPVEEGLDG